MMEGPSDNGAQEKSPTVIKKLFERLKKFLNEMSSLDEEQNPFQLWFEEIFKPVQHDDMVALKDLENFLIDIIKEIKSKNDVLQQSKQTMEKWLVSEIKYIHEMLKQENKSALPHAQPVPNAMKDILKDAIDLIPTIHTKLDALSKEYKTQDRMLPSSQSLTPKGDQKRTVSPGPTKIKTLEKKITDLSKDHERRGNLLEERDKELDKLRQENIKLKEENSTLKRSAGHFEELESRFKKAESELKALRKDNAALEKTRGEAEENVRQLTQVNTDLKQRYSSLAGAKMSHDNADIADLSDPYRPTKIAEMFSELYDNQWTDGFAALTKLGDVEAIRKLMEMLKDTNTFCKREAENLRQTLRSNIQEICTLLNVVSGQSKPKQRKGGQADLMKDKRIYDIIRDNAMLPVEVLQQKYLKESEKKRNSLKTVKGGADAIIDYVKKCVELCWLMVIQSPPVTIYDNVEEYKNQRFDDRRFKHYTKKGQIIDYVVWPMLSISGGGMLGKGVAQCK